VRRIRGGRVAMTALLFLAVSLLAGCPLVSDTPLSDPRSAVTDPGLIGTWRAVDPETGEAHVLRIERFDEHGMVGVAQEADPQKTSIMRLFPTRVGPEAFLSIQELGHEATGWYLARYRLENGALRLKLVDDELFKDRRFSSSDELRAFVARNLADPRLYASAGDTPAEMVLERAEPPADGSGPKS